MKTPTKSIFNNFIGKYSLSKTLRFELIPQGKTLENISEKGLITKDEELARKYTQMKETIDKFHKYFIELAMQNVHLTVLDAYRNLYFYSAEKKKDAGYKKELEKVQTVLRKEIVSGFHKGDAKAIFEKIGKKELITEMLEAWIQKQNDQTLFFEPEFKKFTTYFGGFNENRKNMYSDKEQSTSIAFRLIHDNLPKFLENITTFNKMAAIPELGEEITALYSKIEPYLNVNSINEIFELEYFNDVLTQRDINVYNLVIGGQVAEEGKEKVQGLNEFINRYNQKQKDRNQRIPKMRILYKQILSDREGTSFLREKFDSSQDVLTAINTFYHESIVSFQPIDKEETENVVDKLELLFGELPVFDLAKIYLRNDSQLTNISQKLLGSYSLLADALDYYYNTVIEPDFELKYQKAKTASAKENLEKKKTGILKQAHLSLSMLQEALDVYVKTLDDTHEVHKRYAPNCLTTYFKTHFKAAKKEDSNKEFGFKANIDARYSCVKKLLNSDFNSEKELKQDTKTIENIKLFLDSLMELFHFAKPFRLSADNLLETDRNFYDQFEPLFNLLELLIPLYNKVRDYVTQKAYSIEKVKLNFENAQLLNGWDSDKETEYLSSLFRKDENYYLAIMDKKHNKILSDLAVGDNGNDYQKMNCMLLPGPNKMLPKVFFAKSNIDFFNPSQEILTIRNQGSHTKGGKPQDGYEKKDFNINDCRLMIDFFKESIAKHDKWKLYDFKFRPTKEYSSIDEFYREVQFQGYKISFEKVNSSQIDQLVEEGKLYLFQIYNKDFSTFSKGAPNMHTLYWRQLFSPENLEDVCYKLNGEAEIFFRKKSIMTENLITHKAKEAIANKNPLNKKKTSEFGYDIIKDKRFTVDKFQFHVPITVNFKAEGSEYLNQDVLMHLKNNPDVNIIGIDRGERHLLYITLIDQKGNIILQETMNTISDEKQTKETNYKDLLQKKEDERADARQNWGLIENIKELKAGYLSQVVHKVAKLMVEHNAIVVMEDLNFGFKRGRFKVEKQVYQKFEKMLIDKLNYLVFKTEDENANGGLNKAYQLTNKFTSFRDLGKQSGFLFYVPAWNTSKIDPTTGFVNLFDTRYENMAKAKAFFNSFNSISYNKKQGYFEFDFDYNKFTNRAEETRSKWTVCTVGDRIKTFRDAEKLNNWINETIDLTTEWKTLFEKFQIDVNADLQQQILAQSSAVFYEKAMSLFKLTLQMRNSISNSEVDYMISPVADKGGDFFDSRKEVPGLPKDADANGAYHIAKKGMMWLEQLHAFEEEDLKKLQFDKTNKGWLRFVQGIDKK